MVAAYLGFPCSAKPEINRSASHAIDLVISLVSLPFLFIPLRVEHLYLDFLTLSHYLLNLDHVVESSD